MTTHMDCPGLPHGHEGYVPGRGNLDTAEFFYVGEAPGASECGWHKCEFAGCQWEGEAAVCPRDASTTAPFPSPFVGKAGQLGRRMLRDAGIALDRVYFSNVLRCRPPDNKYPSSKVREACEQHCLPALVEELDRFMQNERDRKVIIAAGAQAFRVLTGLDSISEKRGYVYVPDEDFTPVLPLDYMGAVIPTIHPSFLFRGDGSKPSDEQAEVSRNYLQLTVNDYIKAARIVQTGQLRRPASIFWGDKLPLGPFTGEYLAFDLEWNEQGKITLLGAGTGEDIRVYEATPECLAQFADRNYLIPLVGHNIITADLPQLEAAGYGSVESILERGPVVDTLLQQHLLYPDYDGGMDFWGSAVTDLPYWKDMPERGESVYVYCGRDVYGAAQLYEQGYPRLCQLGMEHILPIQQQCQLALYRMTQRGVHIDRERIPAAQAQLAERIAGLAAKLPFENWASDPQVHAYFKPMYPSRRKFSADKHALVKWAQQGDAVAATLLEVRELDQIRKLYLDPYAEATSDNATIHSRFNVSGQGTGRISSTEPNLAQLPKRPGRVIGSLGAELVRSLIIARHNGWFIVEADWAQIELRVVALLSGTRELLEQLASGIDIHSYYASRFGCTRDQAKVATYGGNYKATAQELARQFDLSVETIKGPLEAFRADYPEIPRWWEQVVKDVVDNNGIQRLPFGRIRRYSGRVADWEKAAIATLPQSTVADMLVRVLIDLERETTQHFEARILFPCHDAVILESPPNELARLRELLNDTLAREWEVPMLGKYHIPISIKTGANWAVAK